MKKLVLLACIALFVFSCKTETEKKEVDMPAAPVAPMAPMNADSDLTPAKKEARAIANAYGAQNWDNITKVDFTFNVDRGGKNDARHWSWNPKTQDVKMTSAEDTVSYNRKDMDSIAIKTDRSFINDSFWLLAPMHLVWDESAVVTKQDTATAPLSGEKAKMITLTYGDEGGYTPGDAYDFYYSDDMMVKEWVYRKGNVSEFSMVTTFEDVEDFNGIKIAKTHNTKEGKLKLYFTDIAVEK